MVLYQTRLEYVKEKQKTLGKLSANNKLNAIYIQYNMQTCSDRPEPCLNRNICAAPMNYRQPCGRGLRILQYIAVFFIYKLSSTMACKE